jgi:hypothetical protein
MTSREPQNSQISSKQLPSILLSPKNEGIAKKQPRLKKLSKRFKPIKDLAMVAAK